MCSWLNDQGWKHELCWPHQYQKYKKAEYFVLFLRRIQCYLFKTYIREFYRLHCSKQNTSEKLQNNREEGLFRRMNLVPLCWDVDAWESSCCIHCWFREQVLPLCTALQRFSLPVAVTRENREEWEFLEVGYDFLFLFPSCVLKTFFYKQV